MTQNVKGTQVIKCMPYQDATFDLMTFAKVSNQFIDTNNPYEIHTQFIDIDGSVNDVIIENVALIKSRITEDVKEESVARKKAINEIITEITSTKQEVIQKLVDESTSRINNDNTIKNLVQTTTSKLENEMKDFDQKVQDESNRAQLEEKKLDENVKKEIQDRIDSDNLLNKKFSSAIQDETNVRDDADKQLSTDIKNVKTSLESELNQEIQERIKGDKDNYNTLKDYIDHNLKDEEVARESEDTKLENEIESEVEARTKADTDLDTAIKNEKSDRESEDTKLENEIESEVEARTKADTDLDTAIKNEKSDRESEDTKLNASIESEVEARTKADTDLDTAIKNEIERAKKVENDLDDKIVAESNIRQANDGDLNFNDDIRDQNGKANSLTKAINIVDNRFTSFVKETGENFDKEDQKITEVSKKVESILAGSTVGLDSFKEIVDWVKSIDTEDDKNLADFIVKTSKKFTTIYNGTGLTDEGYQPITNTHYIKDATSLKEADKKIDNILYIHDLNIKAEVERAKEAEGDLKFTDLQSKDLTNAINELDVKIVKKINEEIDVRTKADTDLNNKLSNEVNIREASDKSLKESLVNEKSERKLSDGSLEFDDDIRDKNGNKAKDLTEAINIVNEKINKLYNFVNNLSNKNIINRNNNIDNNEDIDDNEDKEDNKTSQENQLNNDKLKSILDNVFKK